MSTGLDISIPKSWSWSPLKFTTTFLNRGSAPDYVDEGPVRAISQAANQLTGLDWTRTRFSAHVGDPRRLRGYLLSGDSLINSTGNGTLGRVGYFAQGPDDIPCVADGHVTVARADRRIVEPRYLHYWLSSTLFYNFIYSALVVGATNQIELNREGLAGAPVALPPLDEQRRIAEFLDGETARIDRLTNAQLRALDLLEERAESRIREVIGRSCLVMKGGEPVTQLRHVVQKLARPVAPTDEVITAFRDGQVTARSIRRSEGYTVSASSEPQGQGVEVGDIVIHGLDGFAGAIGDSEASGNCSPVYHVCLPVDGGNAAFYGRLLKLLARDDYLALYGVSARERAVDFRNWKVFGRAPIPRVEPSVQHEIGNMITKIRPLREEVERFNERLAERRQALITAAVTGGITV